jgi:hypothetical protein
MEESMLDVIQRWRRAAERAAEQQIRILRVDGRYLATSASHPLGFYELYQAESGWTCNCPANGEYGLPCKHLWVLTEQLGLDPLVDVALDWDAFSSGLEAA